jgi:hypothetical protein
MQMWSRKPLNSPSLGRHSLWHHGHSTMLMERSAFLFLSWPLDELGWSVWLNCFSFFCSLMLRVASSARAYLLAMVNITSDVLRFFHGELTDQGQVAESLLEEHNNTLVVDLRDDISLIVESLDELLEGLSLLLDDAS